MSIDNLFSNNSHWIYMSLQDTNIQNVVIISIPVLVKIDEVIFQKPMEIDDFEINVIYIIMR